MRNRTSTSERAPLPSGPRNRVDGRKSKVAAAPAPRLPAQTASVTASVKSASSATSSRRDMLEHQVRLRRELAIGPLVAREAAEQMAVQLPDQVREACAARRVETRLGDVFRRRLRGAEIERPALAQVENDPDKALHPRFGVTAPARQPFGPGAATPKQIGRAHV